MVRVAVFIVLDTFNSKVLPFALFGTKQLLPYQDLTKQSIQFFLFSIYSSAFLDWIATIGVAKKRHGAEDSKKADKLKLK